MSLWGIDLGGTKIEGVVLSEAHPDKEICRLRIDTEQEKGYQHILSQIDKLLSQMIDFAQHRPSKVGFGTPGTIEPSTGLMKNSNTQSLNGKPLKDDLGMLLDAECILANDANCFALAEATLGAAKGASTVFGIILGTGVGGGVVVNGKVLRGCQGIAGEWGHNVIQENGPKCYCGKFGCVETLICGPALEEFYLQLSGNKLSLKDIAAQAGDDINAKATIDRLVETFSRAVAVVLNILDPDVVVLGGGVSNISALYEEKSLKLIAKRLFNEGRLETKIVQHQLGDSAGVYGAAMLTL